MSTIDQAFIRAYRDDSVAPAAAAPPWSDSLRPPRSRPLSATTAAPAAKTVDVGSLERLASRVAIIDVGADTLVPSPHAKFEFADAAQEKTPASTQHAKAPLSSFAGGASRQSGLAGTRKPALEVDAVRWPPICATLLAQHAARFDGLVEEIRGEAASGRRVLAISGTRRAEGRTTLALCLARRLATANLRTALVDADFARPGLAKQVSISVQRGWEAVLAGTESLWETMIESLADRFALVPLARTIAAASTVNYRIAATLHELAEAYEVVLVDAGPLEIHGDKTHWLLEPAAGIDGVLLAHDVRHGEAAQLAAACLRLAEARQRQIGIAEMFVSQPSG